MINLESCSQNEIIHIFSVKRKEITEFKNLGGSNILYSFIVKKQKYVIHKLSEPSIINWKQEKAAYDSLKLLNITDELAYYDNGIRIIKFLDNSKTLAFKESDLIDALDSIRKVHERSP